MGKTHTQGPWVAVKDSDGWGVKDSEQKYWLANALQCIPGNVEANARLIAAAPDLLKALEDLMTDYIVGANSGDWGNWDPEQEPEIKAARAAIAKALFAS